MRHGLETRLKMPLHHIKTLTATHGGKQPPTSMPTKSNLIEALEDVIRKSEKGDFVYIHYSGLLKWSQASHD
jgi:fatty acid-binding protein DegV